VTIATSMVGLYKGVDWALTLDDTILHKIIYTDFNFNFIYSAQTYNYTMETIILN